MEIFNYMVVVNVALYVCQKILHPINIFRYMLLAEFKLLMKGICYSQPKIYYLFCYIKSNIHKQTMSNLEPNNNLNRS